MDRTTDQSFVSVVVSFRNECKHLRAHIRALLSQEYPKDKYEIVLIDDGSTDSSLQIAKEEMSAENSPSMKIIHLDWIGTGGARNVGIRESKGEIVAITDADALPDPSWISEISEPLRDKKIGIVCGKIKEVPSLDQMFQGPEQTTYEKTYWFVDVAISRKVFEKTGGFDKRFRRGSDYDVIVRAVNAGFECRYNPKAIVWHLKPQLSLSKSLKAELKNGEADLLFLFVDGKIFLRNLMKLPTSVRMAIANTIAELVFCPLLVLAFLFAGLQGLLVAAIPITLFVLLRAYVSKARRFRLLRALACIPIGFALWYYVFRLLPHAIERRPVETRFPSQ